MAIVHPSDAYRSQLPMPNRKRSHSSMSASRSSRRWIDEETYRHSVLLLPTSKSELEVDESLQSSARDLGLLPLPSSPAIDDISSALSATTIASDTNQGSIISQSTAPTSCASSERRPSTSLSNNSSRLGPKIEMLSIISDTEEKRHRSFKSGLRKMTGFRRKRLSGLNTPSVISIQSHMSGTTKDEAQLATSRGTASIRSGDSHSVPQALPHKQIYDSIPLVDEQALQRSLDCEEIVFTRTQQLEEKRRFLEYQTNLIKDLLAERDRRKAEAHKEHQRRLVEQEERIEKAVEALEARQLEDELKQQKDHEAEKRAIQTRLKHMEAYCQTPSPPQSPTNPVFELRASVDSMRSLPERHVTQQHYENLAQAYHIRDNMDGLHASKINVLRGKQKKTLQNFIMKKERELEQVQRAHKAELDSIDIEYARQEAEIRQEFLLRRTKLEARWKLQALVEKTKAERSTGLKHEGLPDVIAAEA